jgi:hypothetical protein
MGVKRCSTAGLLDPLVTGEGVASVGITDEEEDDEDDAERSWMGLGAGSRGLLGFGGFCGEAAESVAVVTPTETGFNEEALVDDVPLEVVVAVVVDSGGGGIGTLPVKGATSMASSAAG